MLFGTKRLRKLGGDLGSAVKGFRKSMSTDDDPADKTGDESSEGPSGEVEKDK
jgi:Sec-independent protein translocase protein TatA